MAYGSLLILADVDFGHMDWDGWGAVMVFGMLAFWTAVVVLVVWLIRGGAGRTQTHGANQPTALEILDRRFAEGSISADEYRERRDALREARG